jgi:prepilin peptidase CpaA
MVVWRSLAYLPLIVLLVWATVVDLRERRIPNWISFTLIITGFLQGVLHIRGATFTQSLAGFGVGMIPLALYLVGGMGAADVKLSAGIGTWIGPLPMLFVLMGACMVSMIMSICMSLRQGRLLAVVRHSIVMALQLFVGRDPRAIADVRSAQAKNQIPFAVSLAVATVAVVVSAVSGFAVAGLTATGR